MEDFKQYKIEPRSEVILKEEFRAELNKNNDFDRLRIAKPHGFFGQVTPITVRIPGTDAATAANYTTPFFTADRAYEIVEFFERHETAGSDAGTVTVMLKKVPSGTAPGSGTNILTASLNLKATANTSQEGTITSTITNKRLARGDALALVSSGTLTDVAGVTASVILKAI